MSPQQKMILQNNASLHYLNLQYQSVSALRYYVLRYTNFSATYISSDEMLTIEWYNITHAMFIVPLHIEQHLELYIFSSPTHFLIGNTMAAYRIVESANIM